MAIGKTGLERKLDEQIIGKVGYQRYGYWKKNKRN